MTNRHATMRLHSSPANRSTCSPVGATLLALAALLLTTDAIASFNGGLVIGFWPAFVAGMIVSIPGGIACLAAEWSCATRRPPRLVGVAALILGLIALGCVVLVPPDKSAPAIGLYALPPLMTMALVTLLRAPLWRLAVVWLVSGGSMALIMASRPSSVSPSDAHALLGGLLGGALTHMLLWHVGFGIGQIRRRVAGEAPPPGPDLLALMRKCAAGFRIHLPEATALVRLHPGFSWWAGGTLFFFLAMLALNALDTNLLQSAIVISYQVRAMFGVGWTNTGGSSATFANMWLIDGVFWSVIVGAGVWGLAATFRRFDAGALAPFRLVAVVLAAGMILWLAQESSSIRKVNEAEMRATGR